MLSARSRHGSNPVSMAKCEGVVHGAGAHASSKVNASWRKRASRGIDVIASS